jgi:hypothetical protein
VSAIFSILHLGNSWHDCLFAAVVGVMYALVVKKTGSIYGVSISHGLINIVLFLVMPYLALSRHRLKIGGDESVYRQECIHSQISCCIRITPYNYL